MSSMYHLEPDGQTKLVNPCVVNYLRCFIVNQPKPWAHWVLWVEYWFNITFNVSNRITPFEMVYGCKPSMIMRLVHGETRVAVV